ncbi:hypothetical protein LWI28_015664 [Acer negundo]|uniref:Uncharacterized protein n=1 Tax=Acer negundo TaxID=4023 RepID=A0AAD5IMK1_ACENE|nr:hypothetical protein LWI28_015664 [Acer negundo]
MGKEPCDHSDSSCSPSSISISKDKVDDHLPNSDLFASSTTTAENVKSEILVAHVLKIMKIQIKMRILKKGISLRNHSGYDENKETLALKETF